MRTRQHYLPTLNDGTATTVNVSLVGSDGSVIAPTTLKYRLDCRMNRQLIQDWVSVTPLAVTAIPVSGDDNTIINDANPSEVRVMTVVADEGLATQRVTEYAWQVTNLSGYS